MLSAASTREPQALADNPAPRATAHIALTRDVSDRIAHCELTHRDREAIDVAHARAQHAAYENTLRALERIRNPGTVDGGDVLVVAKQVFVGLSLRTNESGIDQLRTILRPYGYTVQAVPVRDCLHLKSAVTGLTDQTLLINRAWTHADTFHGFDLVDVHPFEAFAANALRVGDDIIYAAEFPRTLERLERRGFAPHLVPASELAKAEGAVTCCSLVFTP